MGGAFEPVAVELVAQGVIGKRVDEMESGFLMALDYMIQLAQKDGDDEVPTDLCPDYGNVAGFCIITQCSASLEVIYAFFLCVLKSIS